MIRIFVFIYPLKPSGHYMYHQFNIQQFYVLPTQTVSMCFMWISEQTVIISLYNINWLVFITETECVYCAVRTGCLYINQVNRVFRKWWGGLKSATVTCSLRVNELSNGSIIYELWTGKDLDGSGRGLIWNVSTKYSVSGSRCKPDISRRGSWTVMSWEGIWVLGEGRCHRARHNT